jgi:hypothetical protein
VTGERGPSEQLVGELLTETLEREANAIPVRDGWEAIAKPAGHLVGSAHPLSLIGGGPASGRTVGAVGICAAVAAVLGPDDLVRLLRHCRSSLVRPYIVRCRR